MVGLIWTIQVVHYPLFAAVPEDGWSEYHEQHTRRISWIVGPAMLAELLLALALVALPALGVPPAWSWAGLALLAAAWAVTALCSVPAHSKLAETRPSSALRFLVATNWLRTAAWTLRGVLALALLAGV